MRSIAVAVVLSACVATAWGTGGKDAQKNASQDEPGVAVVLKKRGSEDPYGPSAYSFRYASQDPEIHGNDVDLVFNNCGQLHLNVVASNKSRVAKLPPNGLAGGLPKDGWFSDSFPPEKGAYVMEVEDDATHMLVKFDITDASKSEVKLRWMPVRSPGKGKAGTMGHCGGSHDSK